MAAPAGCCKCATLEGCAVGKAPVCVRARVCARERERASESAGTRERVGASERRASVRPLPAAPQHFDPGTSCGKASSSVHADPPRRPTTCAAALTDGRLASCRTVPPHFARSRSPPAGGGRNARVLRKYILESLSVRTLQYKPYGGTQRPECYANVTQCYAKPSQHQSLAKRSLYPLPKKHQPGEVNLREWTGHFF